MNKEKIKDLIYHLQDEFYNDTEYFEYGDREITDDDIYMLDYYLSCFVEKLNEIIDEWYEVENGTINN